MSTADQKPLIAIGYWRIPKFDFENDSWDGKEYTPEWLADPKRLVEVLGTAAADPAVVRYLQRGRQYESWRGHSWCRFECNAPSEELGHRDLTDGVWLWPEGLAHYVKRHSVPLPEEFLATVRRGSDPISVPTDSTREIDRNFWNTWYARHCTSK